MKKTFLWMIAVIVLVIFIRAMQSPDAETSFHPNAVAEPAGVVICPDSAGARSVFHEKEWTDTLEDTEKKVQAGTPLKVPDLSPYGCSLLPVETPVYVENADATGIIKVAAKMPDGTILHGITRADQVVKSSRAVNSE